MPHDWHPDKFRDCGKGAGNAVFEIFASDVSTDAIRAAWKRGDYGDEQHRPAANHMAGWFKMAGRK